MVRGRWCGCHFKFSSRHKKRGTREASSDQALDHHVNRIYSTVLYFGGSPGLGRCRIPEALQILYGVCYQTNVSRRSGAVSCIVACGNCCGLRQPPPTQDQLVAGNVVNCQSRAAAEHVHWAIFINWLTLLRCLASTVDGAQIVITRLTSRISVCWDKKQHCGVETTI